MKSRKQFRWITESTRRFPVGSILFCEYL